MTKFEMPARTTLHLACHCTCAHAHQMRISLRMRTSYLVLASDTQALLSKSRWFFFSTLSYSFRSVVVTRDGQHSERLHCIVSSWTVYKFLRYVRISRVVLSNRRAIRNLRRVALACDFSDLDRRAAWFSPSICAPPAYRCAGVQLSPQPAALEGSHPAACKCPPYLSAPA